MILNRPHPEKLPSEFFIGYAASEVEISMYNWRYCRAGIAAKGRIPVFVRKSEMVNQGWSFDTSTGNAVSPTDNHLIEDGLRDEITVYNPDTGEYAKLEEV